ncbi:hypothetical protein [Proteus vulgaris]|uniref:hypothetical protein n=1 Tax=Proteus vulgaris TaxID=585 RepID=UPI00288A8A36|nr:hypothetical protein [Proteus vulgaris]
MSDLLYGIATGILTGGITAFITAKLAIRKLYKEKWLEKNYEIYSRLFDALYIHKKNLIEKKEKLELLLGYSEKYSDKNFLEFKGKESLDEVTFKSTFILDDEIYSFIADFLKESEDNYNKIISNEENFFDPDVFIWWYEKDIDNMEILFKKITPKVREILKR